ncbi:hypothetical protein AB0G71_07785 [Streptomyces sp. NPDC020403]|uniref:hypothetical protein n=1 Tax=unclassified Streptomyces TaxID=2593676 RepID=UPI003404F320
MGGPNARLFASHARLFTSPEPAAGAEDPVGPELLEGGEVEGRRESPGGGADDRAPEVVDR